MKPILFKAEMVRAILEGRKTQTRRIVKPQASRDCGIYHRPDGQWVFTQCAGVAVCEPFSAPLGQPGDQLWVKETWRTYASLDHVKPSKIGRGAAIEYAAGGNSIDDDCDLYGMADKWRSPLFMVEWMSRITLELTAVRCERLQDISEADAYDEGVTDSWPKSLPYISAFGGRAVINNYAALWKSINGPDSWAANPWVWCYSFKKI